MDLPSAIGKHTFQYYPLLLWILLPVYLYFYHYENENQNDNQTKMMTRLLITMYLLDIHLLLSIYYSLERQRDQSSMMKSQQFQFQLHLDVVDTNLPLFVLFLMWLLLLLRCYCYFHYCCRRQLKVIERLYHIFWPICFPIFVHPHKYLHIFHIFGHTCVTTRFGQKVFQEISSCSTPPILYAMKLCLTIAGSVCFFGFGRHCHCCILLSAFPLLFF
mmetsp:Transcript_8821/g.10345  ORF Transcript_8821/g.10345 Transcript_8821/m.10345 type:complete len:217 (-) Transcript_8821:61-711(-)